VNHAVFVVVIVSYKEGLAIGVGLHLNGATTSSMNFYILPSLLSHLVTLVIPALLIFLSGAELSGFTAGISGNYCACAVFDLRPSTTKLITDIDRSS
jgi:hypothetical protein